MEEYHIVKIINFPLKDNQTKDIDVDFKISTLKKESIFMLNDDFMELIDNNKVYEYNSNIPYLYAIDEQNNKITLYNVSYKIENFFEQKITLCQNAFLIGDHIDDINNENVVSISTVIYEDRYKYSFKNLKAKYRHFNIQIAKIIKTINLNCFGENEHYIGKAKFSIQGSDKFLELSQLFQNICELWFFIHGTYPEYTYFEIEKENKKILYWHYSIIYSAKVKKQHIVENLSEGNFDFEKSIDNYINFRKTSGLIVDWILHTIYSYTCEEEYPLKLAQALDGFMVYSGLAFYKVNDYNKEEFIKLPCHIKEKLLYIFDRDVLEKSIKHTEKNIKIFNSKQEKNEFINNVRNHRNLFSHAKYNGKKISGKQNIDYANKLFTILRYLIINYFIDENYFSNNRILQKENNKNEQ